MLINNLKLIKMFIDTIKQFFGFWLEKANNSYSDNITFPKIEESEVKQEVAKL